MTHTQISFDDHEFCSVAFRGGRAKTEFRLAHRLTKSPELWWVNRTLEYLVSFDGTAICFGVGEGQQSLHDTLKALDHKFCITMNSLPFTPLQRGTCCPFAENGADDFPSSGILLMTSISSVRDLFGVPAQDEDEEEDFDFGDSGDEDIVLLVFDDQTEKWRAVGQWSQFGDRLHQSISSESLTLLELLDEIGGSEMRDTHILENCWYALPVGSTPLRFKNSDGTSFRRRFVNDDQLHRIETRLRNSVVDRLIRGSILAIKDRLSDFRGIGPKRRDVPRSLTAQTSREMTSWRDGGAGWSTLLICEQSGVDKISSWLSDEAFLNTGYCLIRAQAKIVDENSLKSLAVRMSDSKSISDCVDEFEAVFCNLASTRTLSLKPVSSEALLPFQNVGEGITQVVPVLVACLGFSGMIAVEQPELHLHPSIQARLGDIFLQALPFRDRCLLLLETHSEHLILRILRRIRQTTEGDLPPTGNIPPVKPDDVCVLWVDNLGDGTVIKRLRINGAGEFIDQWPKGFFREREEDLFG